MQIMVVRRDSGLKAEELLGGGLKKELMAEVFKEEEVSEEAFRVGEVTVWVEEALMAEAEEFLWREKTTEKEAKMFSATGEEAEMLSAASETEAEALREETEAEAEWTCFTLLMIQTILIREWIMTLLCPTLMEDLIMSMSMIWTMMAVP
jgi:hypothetical protein